MNVERNLRLWLNCVIFCTCRFVSIKHLIKNLLLNTQTLNCLLKLLYKSFRWMKYLNNKQSSLNTKVIRRSTLLIMYYFNKQMINDFSIHINGFFLCIIHINMYTNPVILYIKNLTRFTKQKLQHILTFIKYFPIRYTLLFKE